MEACLGLHGDGCDEGMVGPCNESYITTTTYPDAHPSVLPILQIALSPFCGENVDGATCHLPTRVSHINVHVQEEPMDQGSSGSVTPNVLSFPPIQ